MFECVPISAVLVMDVHLAIGFVVVIHSNGEIVFIINPSENVILYGTKIV